MAQIAWYPSLTAPLQFSYGQSVASGTSTATIKALGVATYYQASFNDGTATTILHTP